MSTTLSTPVERPREVPGGAVVQIERLISGSGAQTFRLHVSGETSAGRYEDYHEADTVDLSRAILAAVLPEVAAHRRADLGAIAGDLKRRHRGAAGTVRRIYGGGLILGDTAPDERPDFGS